MQFLDAEPSLEPDWEEAVEGSIELTGSELVVMGWAAKACTMFPCRVPVPTPGTYRVRYSASGMDAGRQADSIDPPPDRYRIQCWPAPIS